MLTHARLIITPGSLQVSMRSFASEIRLSGVSRILASDNTLDLCAVLLVMLLHTNPVKQTKVRFPYVLFKAQLCHSPVCRSGKQHADEAAVVHI